MKKLRVIKVERIDNNLNVELITIRDDIEDFYKEINCDAIDIIRRKIGNTIFTIICDDMGLLKANTRNELPTSWWQDERGHEALCGTLLLCHNDNEGNLTNADNFEAIEVELNIMPVKRYDGEVFALLFHELR